MRQGGGGVGTEYHQGQSLFILYPLIQDGIPSPTYKYAMGARRNFKERERERDYVVLPSSLKMISMMKQRQRNASSTIFIIELSPILLELPSKFFGHSCYSYYSPLLSTGFHFLQAFEQSTIPIIPLDIPPMMTECLLEESYLLPDDLFFHVISYITVSFTLFLFLTSSNRSHHFSYKLLLCSSPSFIQI